jgi:hypothetical protein
MIQPMRRTRAIATIQAGELRMRAHAANTGLKLFERLPATADLDSMCVDLSHVAGCSPSREPIAKLWMSTRKETQLSAMHQGSQLLNCT